MRRVVWLALAFALAASPALAQSRINLTYEGRVTDADGVPTPTAVGGCGGRGVSYCKTTTMSPDTHGWSII